MYVKFLAFYIFDFAYSKVKSGEIWNSSQLPGQNLDPGSTIQVPP